MVWALIGFSIPSLIVRFYFRRDFSLKGGLQDLFTGAQIGTLSLISPWLASGLQLLALYDGMIDQKLHFRLDGSVFPFLFQIKDFKDSAQ